MSYGFEDKVAIITGGTRGIGKAIATSLVNEGAYVILFARDKKRGELAANKLGPSCSFKKTDVSKRAEVKGQVKGVYQEHGRIDYLVNNAGINRDRLLLRMQEEDWQEVLSVNLTGVYNCTQAVSRYMIKQKYGSIVNISSVAGQIGNPGQSNYAAAKAGVLGFTKSVARELASRNIRVNAIAPGFIQTDMTKKMDDDLRQRYLSEIPLDREGDPNEVAEATLFLLSDRSSYITGEVLNVDGGLVMG